ncbi:MAG: FIST C-terminal domain-containing protein [Clostridiales bacterium]|jgi:hypothetical protein|nr:FIST C-terminal domain-containing protein [Clostridiales bacterium]
MINMLNAYATDAYADDFSGNILKQLDMAMLKKNTIGIISCGHEFVESGAIAGLCQRLPFEVLGCTTFGCAVNGMDYEKDVMALSVLTSDDVVFSTAATEPLTVENIDEVLSDAYSRALCGRAEKPVFILAFLPFLYILDASVILEVLNRICGDVPVFGGGAANDVTDSLNDCMIHNGTAVRGGAVLALMWGDVKPRFFVNKFVGTDELYYSRGVVTESEGNVIKCVNDKVFEHYLQNIGMPVPLIKKFAVMPVPFMIDYHDGNESLLRVMHKITDEGYAVFSTKVPEGSSLVIYDIGHKNLVNSVLSVAKDIVSPDTTGILIFSCVLRSILLELNLYDEMKEIVTLLGSTPYHFMYTGGELCPRGVSSRYLNYFYNGGLIACTF